MFLSSQFSFPVGNPCAGHNCTFKCLPSHGADGKGKFTCACPDTLIPVNTPEQCKCPGDEIFDRTSLKCKPGKHDYYHLKIFIAF